MLRWAFLTSLVVIAAAVVLLPNRPVPAPQPINYSHKTHLDYFLRGDHRREMIGMHEKLLLEELGGDKQAVGEITAQVEKGNCPVCHRDFDDNARNLPKLAGCGQCHREYLARQWQTERGQRPCLDCHHVTGESSPPRLPSTKVCAACHVPPRQPGHEEERKLADFAKQGKKIPWLAVYDYLPGDIVFSHQRHVEIGKVKCQECHGQVQQAQEPLRLEVKLSMEDCMACHEARHANNDCLACHK